MRKTGGLLFEAVASSTAFSTLELIAMQSCGDLPSLERYFYLPVLDCVPLSDARHHGYWWDVRWWDVVLFFPPIPAVHFSRKLFPPPSFSFNVLSNVCCVTVEKSDRFKTVMFIIHHLATHYLAILPTKTLQIGMMNFILSSKLFLNSHWTRSSKSNPQSLTSIANISQLSVNRVCD